MQPEEIQERLQRLVRRYGTPTTPSDEMPAPAAGHRNVVKRVNHSCGDAVELVADEHADSFYLRVQGCSVCRAAAMVVAQIICPSSPRELAASLLVALENPAASNSSALVLETIKNDAVRSDVEDLLLIAHLPGRRRCATLPVETVLEYHHNRAKD